MTKFASALILAAIGFAGAAIAQTEIGPPHGRWGGGMGSLMRADANGDGIVTRDEAAAAADRQFDRIDANHDGRIDPDEMAAYHAAMAARRNSDGPSPAGASRPNPDGGTTTTREAYRARALARFDRMDANHDGRIDQAEMAAMRAMRADRRGRPTDGGAPPPVPASEQ